jgi:long-chain fatty acid transport protein
MQDGWKVVAAMAAAWGLLAMPEAAQAAGFSNTAQSAVANSMAATGVANPREPNKNFYNPANMAGKEGFEGMLGVTLLSPLSSYESFDGSVQTDTQRNWFPPPNASLSYGISETVAVGLGFTMPWGLAVEWPDEWVGREAIQFQQLQTFDINPNVAVKIGDTGLKVAAGAQVILSTLQLDRRIILRDDTEVQVNLAGSGQGYGATAAVMYQPTDDLTLGLNYRSAVKLNFDGRSHFEGEEGTTFEDDFQDGDVTTSLTVPHFLAFGIGYQFNRLFVEADLNYTTWSTYDEVVIDFENDSPSDTSTIEANWNNAIALRFGAEYQVTENIPVRLGFAYDRTPIPDETLSPSLPGNHRLSASAGLGYKTGKFSIDAGYQLVTTLEREVRNDVAPNGNYQVVAHVLGLNVGYGFGGGKAKSKENEPAEPRTIKQAEDNEEM